MYGVSFSLSMMQLGSVHETLNCCPIATTVSFVAISDNRRATAMNTATNSKKTEWSLDDSGDFVSWASRCSAFDGEVTVKKAGSFSGLQFGVAIPFSLSKRSSAK